MGRPTGRRFFCSFVPQFGDNASTSDNGQPNTLQEIRGKCAAYGELPRPLLLLAAAALLAGCEEPGDVAAAVSEPEPVARVCGEDGFLATALYGAIATELDWTAADLACEGMPRPDGEGARLRFAGSDGPRQIAIIIALPALERGSTASELPSNVTLIEEGNGRFFSTADLDNCWTDITTSEALGESATRYRIGGTLYCVQPLAEVNGSSSITLSEMRFSGLLDWSAT